MKLMFVSDIHGSEYYLDLVLEAYKDGHYDRMVLLGDVLYHGPRNPLPKGYNPKNVAEKLNTIAQDIIAIRGNCDSEVDQMVLDFPILQESAHVLTSEATFYLCHGHQLTQEGMKLREGTIVCHGHTHIPRDEVVHGLRYFNPGSIALPKEGSAHSYGVYDDKGLRRVNL